MLQQRTFDSPECTLNFGVGPDSGPPLLFLHGVVRRWQDFANLIPEVLPRWQVYGLDFRGHGRSSAAAPAYQTIDYARDAQRMLTEQVGRPAILFGHSLGAMAAFQVAAEMPELVAAIILEDPPFETMGEEIEATALHCYFQQLSELAQRHRDVPTLAGALADLRFSSPDEQHTTRLGDVRDAVSLRFSASCLLQLDLEVFKPILNGRWLEDYDVATLAGQVACPVLLLQADASAGGMLTDSRADMLRQTLADCSLIQFPGCGHLIHWTRREALLEATHGFLASLS